ncbi:DUF3800 domain-containing protein [Ralstonia pseudosolanacearum]|uniref:DUF3800 domain-containing protein n=1 Tax=Ralstonia solanacearum TaxID=305 RepID=A0A0S4TPA7_RALSL|nr:hypothetical protein RSP799_13015 [Ralstonia solanacearum]CUV11883.1 conserved protein of unknown function [Ralstonia solanacearum]
MSREKPEESIIDVNRFRPIGLDFMPNVDKRYTLYYDETNNIRRLVLAGTGLNHDALDCFVLGGIALEPRAVLPDIAALRAQLRIQPSAREMKLRHLVQGDYAACLGSRKVEHFLAWLLDAPAYIHYSNFSVLNWSIVDLIDSLIVSHRFRHLIAVHNELKNELHALVRLDPLAYFRLLKTFNYPDVAVERIPEFVRSVRAFLFRNGFVFRNFATMTLCDLLQEAADDTTLDFLVGNDSGVLVGSFDTVFLNRLATFTNAVHVFDEEPQIRSSLDQRRIFCGDQAITYCFANSRHEPAIQVSDVLCGILGKHFSCMEKLSIEQLEAWNTSLSDQQRRNVALLAKLIDKADEECHALIFNQAPNDSKAKSLWFLHGIEYPEDYRDC